MRTLCLLVLVYFLTPQAIVGQEVPTQQLAGRIGTSAAWGSAWLDLDRSIDFHEGDRLRITTRGGVKRMLVRLLTDPGRASEPEGIAGAVIAVPSNGVAEVVLTHDYPDTRQISIHGGSRAWHVDLGQDNPGAELVAVERRPAVPAPPSSQKPTATP